MKRSYQRIAGLCLMLALLSGCGSASPPTSDQAVSANPHVLAGYPPLPAPDQPSPLGNATPFGLYAVAPSPATVEALAKGVTSPDARFRAALTDQGAWAVRIDGAWYWQIELTTITQAGAQPGQATGAQTGQATQQPLGPQAGQTALAPSMQTLVPVVLGGWTPKGQLLVQATGGAWFEANPLTATVTPLAPFWQGRQGLLVSPDDKQILYNQTGPKGPQVWVANRDGSRPTLVADNATAVWSADGKPAISKLPDPVAPPKTNGQAPKAPTTPATGTPPAATTPPATPPPAAPPAGATQPGT